MSAAPVAQGALSAAQRRWHSAAGRLELSGPARTLAGALLAAELKTEEGLALDRRSALSVGKTCKLSDRQALAALVELERRRVVSPLSDGVRAWLATSIAIAPRVREHFLGIAPARAEPETPALPARLEAQIDELMARSDLDRHLVVIRGRRGSGRAGILSTVQARFGAGVLRRTPLELAAPSDPLEPELSGHMVVWDARDHDPSPDDLARASRWLSRGATLAACLLDRRTELPRVAQRRVLAIDADPPTLDERRELWTRALESPLREHADVLARELRVGHGLVQHVARELREQPPLGRPDAMVGRARRALDVYLSPATLRGVRVETPNVSLDDLVLDPRMERSVSGLLALARTDGAAMPSRRLGVKALLAGPPGTGKTMTAAALAHALGRPLYRIDLSSVVSKWIGETERNLADAFEAAHAVGAVLLFDEGDALFGQRGEVARGTDRYANLEVAYLLQALEEHDGVVVVTTNAQDKIDAAFLRRFDFVLSMNPPDASLRERLWRQELGVELCEDLAAELAHRGELTGGHIAAAARVAWALARDRGAPEPTRADLLEALALETGKRGGRMAAARLLEEADAERTSAGEDQPS